MQELDARIDALADRIAAALARAQSPIRAPRSDALADEERAQLRAELERAEGSASLQALRCAALEDRIVELEAALVGARDHRARAEALAESAKREADEALDELERLRGAGGGPTVDMSIGETLQAKLLEIERLTHERDDLRRTTDELRTRNRELRRERDEATLVVERTSSQLEELRARDTSNRSKLGELERIIDEQRRELELAERRAAHMRQRLGAR